MTRCVPKYCCYATMIYADIPFATRRLRTRFDATVLSRAASSGPDGRRKDAPYPLWRRRCGPSRSWPWLRRGRKTGVLDAHSDYERWWRISRRRNWRRCGDPPPVGRTGRRREGGGRWLGRRLPGGAAGGGGLVRRSRHLDAPARHRFGCGRRIGKRRARGGGEGIVPPRGSKRKKFGGVPGRRKRDGARKRKRDGVRRKRPRGTDVRDKKPRRSGFRGKKLKGSSFR